MNQGRPIVFLSVVRTISPLEPIISHRERVDSSLEGPGASQADYCGRFRLRLFTEEVNGGRSEARDTPTEPERVPSTVDGTQVITRLLTVKTGVVVDLKRR